MAKSHFRQKIYSAQIEICTYVLLTKRKHFSNEYGKKARFYKDMKINSKEYGIYKEQDKNKRSNERLFLFILPRTAV